jgi:hypothetical protein
LSVFFFFRPFSLFSLFVFSAPETNSSATFRMRGKLGCQKKAGWAGDVANARLLLAAAAALQCFCFAVSEIWLDD